MGQTRIQEDHDFSIELASQRIPVVAPLIFNKQSLHIYKDFYFALFPSIGGRQFEVDNLEYVEWMGRSIGRIHAVAKTRDFEHRPTMSVEEYLQNPLQELQNSLLIPFGLHTSFFNIL